MATDKEKENALREWVKRIKDARLAIPVEVEDQLSDHHWNVIKSIEQLADLVLSDSLISRRLAQKLDDLYMNGVDRDLWIDKALALIREHYENPDELIRLLQVSVSMTFLRLRTRRKEVLEALVNYAPKRGRAKPGQPRKIGEPEVLARLNELAGKPLGHVDARAISEARNRANQKKTNH